MASPQKFVKDIVVSISAKFKEFKNLMDEYDKFVLLKIVELWNVNRFDEYKYFVKMNLGIIKNYTEFAHNSLAYYYLTKLDDLNNDYYIFEIVEFTPAINHVMEKIKESLNKMNDIF